MTCSVIIGIIIVVKPSMSRHTTQRIVTFSINLGEKANKFILRVANCFPNTRRIRKFFKLASEAAIARPNLNTDSNTFPQSATSRTC
jgi:hypothetical protein